MADIELVIKIPEELTSKINDENYENIISWFETTLYCAIRDGTLLPKGHGRLMILSEDKLKENQINLDFTCQKWISEVALSQATVAIIEEDTPKRRKGTPLEENDNGYNCENWIP